MARVHRAIAKDEKRGLYDILSRLRRHPGVVRGENSEGDKVTGLRLEAYEEKADEILEQICQELREREGIIDVQIYHLLGDFEVSEELVYVLVAGSHRREVFETLELAVEKYKQEAPIFKKEFTIDSESGERREYWIEEKNWDRRP